jgi:hypothetical protein
MKRNSFQAQLDSARCNPCSQCGERGHLVFRVRGGFTTRCKACKHERTYTVTIKKGAQR